MIKHEVIHFLGFNKDTLKGHIVKEDDENSNKFYIEDLTDKAKTHFGTEKAKVYLETFEDGETIKLSSHLKKKYFNGDVMVGGSGAGITVSSFTTEALSLLEYRQFHRNMINNYLNNNFVYIATHFPPLHIFLFDITTNQPTNQLN